LFDEKGKNSVGVRNIGEQLEDKNTRAFVVERIFLGEVP
jgi:hypothetical protein